MNIIDEKCSASFIIDMQISAIFPNSQLTPINQLLSIYHQAVGCVIKL